MFALRDDVDGEKGEPRPADNDETAIATPLRTSSTIPGVTLPPERTTTTRPKRTTTTRKTTQAKTEAASQRTPRCGSSPPDEAVSAPDNWATLWKTKPDDNQPVVIQICIDDVTPQLGQTVELRVVADDPDALIGTDECDIVLEWDGDREGFCRENLKPVTEPQPTPAKQRGHVDLVFRHTYGSAGKKIIDVEVWSGSADGTRNPYQSAGDARLAVTVSK